MFRAMDTIYSSCQLSTQQKGRALPYLQLATCPLVHLFMPYDHGDPQRRH
ncbi:DUF2933 domain-containing protein [Pseudomonas sp. SID14000]